MAVRLDDPMTPRSERNPVKHLQGAILALTTLALVTACTTSAPPPAPHTSESSESTYGGFAVDPPADDEIVLTIVGLQTTEYTYADLQSRASVEITIDEPFVRLTQTFRGVPLAELFAEAGIDAEARVETIALNDYRYADTVGSWVDGAALLAVFRDGELIPMDAGGPIRIVFDSSSSQFENIDAWNWSLRSIEVVGG